MHAGSSSLTGDRTQAPYTGSVESYPLDHQGSPLNLNNFFFLEFFFVVVVVVLNLFLAALGLRCCTQAFSSCGEWGLLFIAVRRLLIAVASLVAEHRL